MSYTFSEGVVMLKNVEKITTTNYKIKDIDMEKKVKIRFRSFQFHHDLYTP
jgi:hypothetical protein